MGTTPRRILVVIGPRVDLGSDGLEWSAPNSPERLARLCAEAGRGLGVAVTLVDTDGEPTFADTVRQAGEDADAVVFAPGPGLRGSSTAREALAEAEVPAVEVVPGDLREPLADHGASAFEDVRVRLVAGRGADVFLGAIRHLVHRAAWPAETIRYGEDVAQVGDLRLPTGAGPHPVVVLLHGGYWWPWWERDRLEGIAVDLARRGVATWNVEYRRTGRGGGWPQTAEDVVAGVAHLERLASSHDLDLDHVTLLGHSAGATLAVWAAAGTAGERAEVAHIGALAGVLDFAPVRETRFGRSALHAFFGAETDDALSPSRAVPVGVPAIVAHAADDALVPVASSRLYVDVARGAGDEVVFSEPARGGHHGLLEPDSAPWKVIADQLLR